MASISFLRTMSPSNHKLRSLDGKEMITNLIGFDHYKNSPHQHLRECSKNRMENMHTDVRV